MRGEKFLATAMAPDVVDGSPSKTTALQRRVLAVIGAVTGNGATVTFERLVEQWPAWVPMPHEKVLHKTLRRLVERQVVDLPDGRGYRRNPDLIAAAARLGARFRFVPEDFDGSLTPAETDVLALIRGMRSARGHSAGYLGDLLGRDEKTVRLAVAGLRRKGRLQVAGETRLRRGNRIPVLLVVESPKPENVQLAGNSSPGRGNRSPGRGNRSPDTLYSPREYPTGSDHPRPVALLTWIGPAAPDQSRGSAADDPRAPQPAEQQIPPPAAKVVRPWLRTEALEQRAAAAVRTWPAFWNGLREATARLHLALSTVDDVHEALLAVGMFVPTGPMTSAGRAGLRRKRVALAELLVVQRVEPSEVLEAVFLIARQIEPVKGATPSRVAAAFVTTLQAKAAEFVERSRARVAGGGAALPMAAGADAIDRLVQPQRRRIGDFAYPPHWWHDAVPEQVHDRIRGLRELLELEVGAREVREVGGEIAAQRLRREAADRRQAEHDREQRHRLHEAQHREHGRLVGAAQARDWRRLARWMPPGMTAADIAKLAGIAEATIAAGLAGLAQRATA